MEGGPPDDVEQHTGPLGDVNGRQGVVEQQQSLDDDNTHRDVGPFGDNDEDEPHVDTDEQRDDGQQKGDDTSYQVSDDSKDVRKIKLISNTPGLGQTNNPSNKLRLSSGFEKQFIKHRKGRDKYVKKKKLSLENNRDIRNYFTHSGPVKSAGISGGGMGGDGVITYQEGSSQTKSRFKSTQPKVI